MQHLKVSGAVRPLKWPLGVKWLIHGILQPTNAILYTVKYYSKMIISKHLKTVQHV